MDNFFARLTGNLGQCKLTKIFRKVPPLHLPFSYNFATVLLYEYGSRYRLSSQPHSHHAFPTNPAVAVSCRASINLKKFIQDGFHLRRVWWVSEWGHFFDHFLLSILLRDRYV
jgi:hypothetical protein